MPRRGNFKIAIEKCNPIYRIMRVYRIFLIVIGFPSHLRPQRQKLFIWLFLRSTTLWRNLLWNSRDGNINSKYLCLRWLKKLTLCFYVLLFITLLTSSFLERDETGKWEENCLRKRKVYSQGCKLKLKSSNMVVKINNSKWLLGGKTVLHRRYFCLRKKENFWKKPWKVKER